MPWQEYVVRWVIRESEGIISRSRVRRRLVYGLLLAEVSLGAWNIAFLREGWMVVPMGIIVGLIFWMAFQARADQRKAEFLRDRARELASKEEECTS